MAAGDLMDEMDCNSFFDQMDDLIEFPADEDPGSFSGLTSDLSGIWSNPLPYEDIAQLEWLSNFVEDSFSGGGLTITKGSLLNKESSSEESQTSSAISTGSSCSGEKVFSRSPTQRGVRTKRPRPTTFNPPAFLSSKILSGEEMIMAPHPGEKSPEPAAASTGDKKRRKKIRLSLPQGPVEANQNPNVESVRKCMHCEITKTPQWRAGPMGPKTLCNACGVRYKSGRLFPEYRPAASPTFVASVHSNSHRKVLEMRSRSDEKRSIFLSTTTVEPEVIPSSRVSFD